jgi:hypothetical protein
MGSYFSKPPKQKNISFESIERSVEALNPNQYPVFEKTMDWAKTRHIYSEQICLHEKYYSWGIISILLILLSLFLYSNYSNQQPEDIDLPYEQQS